MASRVSKLCVNLSLTIIMLLAFTTRSYAKLNDIFQPIYLTEWQSLDECHKIVKDDQGYMWIAYAGGIARYDGSSIKEYPMEYNFHRTIHKMSNGDILAINEDMGFQVWKYDPIADIYRDITPTMGISDDVVIACSVADENNNLWIANSEGLMCLSNDTQEWTYLDILRGANIVSLVPYGDNLAVLESNKLHKLQIKKEITQTLYLSHQLLSEEITPTTALYDKEMNSIYFGTISQGLVTYNIESGELKSTSTLKLDGAPILTLSRYGNNKLLVGTDGLGIYMINKSNGKILRHFSCSDRYNYNILSNAIYDIFVDEQAQIYAATYAHSVQVLNPNALDYRLLIPRTESGQPMNTAINALCLGADGKLWMGTDVGVFSTERATQRWRHYLPEGQSSNGKCVIMDIESVGDKLFACGYGDGLMQIDPQGEKLQRVTPISNCTNNSNYLFKLHSDSEKQLWMGGISSLFRYGFDDHELSCFGDRGGVSAITNMSSDVLIYCAGYDLLTLDKTTKKIEPFDFPESLIEQVGMTPKVRDVIRYSKKLFFATNNCGLLEYDMSRNEFTSYNTILGDDYRNILAFEIDKSGNAWIASSKGVAFVDTDKKCMRSYKRSSFFNVDSFIKGSSLLTRNGEVIFGTMNGALVIDADLSSEIKERCLPRITDLKISYNSVLQDRALIELDKPLNEMESIELNYNQNTFSFTLGHIDYSRFDRPIYSWRLTDFDKEWMHPTSSNIAGYRRVPSGNYTFQFRVYNALNSEEFVEKSIEVIIHKPWYASWYMIAVYTLFVIMVIFTGLYTYVRRQERIASQERIDYYMNALHSIHTPIMLIKAPLEYLKREMAGSTTSQHLLSNVSKNIERVYSLVNQQIDYRSVIGDTKLEMQEVSLADYYRELMDNFWEYALANNVTLKLSFDKENRSVYTSRDILDKVMDNLISNGIKYSQNSGEVTITVDYKRDYWSIKIHNNGCHIPSKEQRNIFRRLYRATNSVNLAYPSSGLGLLFTYRLVGQLDGSISFESNSRRGTTFRVKFPMASSADVGKLDDILVERSERVDLGLDRIIIMDDELKIRNHFADLFDGRYRVDVTRTASDIVTTGSHSNVALILLNMTLPNVDPNELCRQIRATDGFESVDIVAITSSTDEASVMIGAEYNIVDMISYPFDMDMLGQCVERVLSAQFESDEASEVSMSDADREFIEQVDEIIKRNLANHDFNIDMICKSVCMSRSVFYNRMKSITSLTPNEMLRDTRMKYAAELLCSKNHTIQEVSDMVGFADPKYFSRVFFKYHKCYPSKYLG